MQPQFAIQQVEAVSLAFEIVFPNGEDGALCCLWLDAGRKRERITIIEVGSLGRFGAKTVAVEARRSGEFVNQPIANVPV